VMKNEKPTPAAPPAVAGKAAPGGGAGNGPEALGVGGLASSVAAVASAAHEPPADVRGAPAELAGAGGVDAGAPAMRAGALAVAGGGRIRPVGVVLKALVGLIAAPRGPAVRPGEVGLAAMPEPPAGAKRASTAGGPTVLITEVASRSIVRAAEASA
jgi:hypothetical protein